MNWQNPADRFDVNGDGTLNSLDKEVWESIYAEAGTPAKGFMPLASTRFFPDVNGDRWVDLKDAGELIREMERRFAILPPDAYGLRLMPNGNYKLACGNKLPGATKSAELNSLSMGGTSCETGRQIAEIKILKNDIFGRCYVGSTVFLVGTKVRVTGGCDGEFELVPQKPAVLLSNGDYRVECKALDYGRNECDLGKRIVNMAWDSSAPYNELCTSYNPRWGRGTFGFSGTKVWVDGKCKGVFRVTLASEPRLLPNGNYQVDCHSSDTQKTYCEMGFPIDQVKVLSQTSDSEKCDPYYQTYGVLGTKLWVKKCRGTFEIVPRGANLPPVANNQLTCQAKVNWPYPLLFAGALWTRTEGEGTKFRAEDCMDVCGPHNVDIVAMHELAGSKSAPGACRALAAAFQQCGGIQKSTVPVASDRNLKIKESDTSEPCGYEYSWTETNQVITLLRGRGYTDSRGKRIETEPDGWKSGTISWEAAKPKVSRNYFCACNN